MITLKEYLNNPCGTLSIPYWKNKTIKISNNITDNISYDPFGRVTEIISGNISKIYSYDNNSNITSFKLTIIM